MDFPISVGLFHLIRVRRDAIDLDRVNLRGAVATELTGKWVDHITLVGFCSFDRGSVSYSFLAKDSSIEPIQRCGQSHFARISISLIFAIGIDSIRAANGPDCRTTRLDV